MHVIAVTAAGRLSPRNRLTYAKHPIKQATQRARTGKSAPGDLEKLHTWRPHRFGRESVGNAPGAASLILR
jgi:hypothetical protein